MVNKFRTVETPAVLFLYVKNPISHVLFIVQTFCYNILEIRLRKVHNERENMAIYFIDGDNNPKEHIKGIELLAAGDEVHIFYAAKNTYYLSDKNRKAIMASTEFGGFRDFNCDGRTNRQP